MDLFFKILFIYFLVNTQVGNIENFSQISKNNKVRRQAETKLCILPPHPVSGKWSVFKKNPKNLTSGLQLQPYSVLRIDCDETYKLDGCPIVGCVNGKWFPPIGRCLKTCPSISSTTSMTVTCVLNERRMKDCVEPLSGTLATFRCASFYEYTTYTLPRAVCTDGKWSQNIPECTPACGRRSHRYQPTNIIGSNTMTQMGEFPWQIAIYQTSDKDLLCGGTLLSERVVLTAAHCISDGYGHLLDKKKYIIVAGKYYRQFNSTNPNERNFIQISEIHKMFIPSVYKGDTQNYLGDIAVIITSKSFKFSVRVQPACVDWSRQYEELVINSGSEEAHVSGWGLTEETGKPANELRSIKIPSILSETCVDFLPESFQRFMTYDKLCAGYINRNITVCRGDSGGGLMFQHENRFFVAGVVSVGPRSDTTGGCDSQNYGLFTLVYHYTDNFILDKLERFKPTSSAEENVTTQKPTATTEAPYGYCGTPQQPEFGQFYLISQNATTSPKTNMKFPFETKLLLKCDDKYKLEGSSEMICNNGNWSTVGKCIKTCPTLSSSSTMEVNCTYNDMLLTNCTEPLDRTVATFRCSQDTDEIVGTSGLPGLIRICVDGKWRPNWIPECVPKCGYQYDVLHLENDGSVIVTTNLPWHVGIYIDLNDNTTNLVCGGTLIGPRTIITAASCIDTKKIRDYRVVASFFLDEFVVAPPSPIKEHQIKRIELIINSDQYKPNTYESDLAIIIIKEPFEIGLWVRPICIDWKRLLNIRRQKPEYSISSWRPIKEQNPIPPWQQKVKIISNTIKCFKNFTEHKSNYYTSDKICASSLSNDSSVCGQTGNGLIYHYRERYYLLGVASGMPQSPNTKECEDRGFGIFTKITTFAEKLLEIEARYKD